MGHGHFNERAHNRVTKTELAEKQAERERRKSMRMQNKVRFVAKTNAEESLLHKESAHDEQKNILISAKLK